MAKSTYTPVRDEAGNLTGLYKLGAYPHVSPEQIQLLETISKLHPQKLSVSAVLAMACIKGLPILEAESAQMIAEAKVKAEEEKAAAAAKKEAERLEKASADASKSATEGTGTTQAAQPNATANEGNGTGQAPESQVAETVTVPTVSELKPRTGNKKK